MLTLLSLFIDFNSSVPTESIIVLLTFDEKFLANGTGMRWKQTKLELWDPNYTDRLALLKSKATKRMIDQE